jgi:alpha-glucosidase
VDLAAAALDREADMGTFGTGPFSSDSALDLLDKLAGQHPDQRRQALERIFSQVRDDPGLLWRKFVPDEIVAAAAIVAAGLPGGEDIRQELSDQAYDPNRLIVPAPGQELTTLALQALLVAAGPGGPWHQGWVDQQTAAGARQTIDRLTGILTRE